MSKAQPYNAVRQRYGFYTHVAVYVLASMVLWFVYGFTFNHQWQLLRYPPIGVLVGVALILSIPWPLLIMSVWGIVLLAHGIESAVHRKIVINREIERDWGREMIFEKPKRDAPMMITDDDSEIEEVPEDEDYWAE